MPRFAELPLPGDMLLNKSNDRMVMVVSSRAIEYPGPWTQFHVNVLDRDRVVLYDVDDIRFTNMFEQIHDSR
jgi:hypothetical protein